jgi:hypothetical protein
LAYIKRYNGSSWVNVPIKRFNGSNWVDVDVYKYDGSKWVKLTAQTYEKTWGATWSHSYRGNRNYEKRPDSRGASGLMQGNSGEDPWGTQRSLVGFGDIRSTIAGAKIESIKLYLKAKHFWYYSGGTAVIGYHNHSSEPNNFSHSKYGQKNQKFSSRTEALWINMPIELGNGIRDGRYKGISLYANSTSKNYYGEWYGEGSSYEPKLKIKYTK